MKKFRILDTFNPKHQIYTCSPIFLCRATHVALILWNIVCDLSWPSLAVCNVFRATTTLNKKGGVLAGLKYNFLKVIIITLTGRAINIKIIYPSCRCTSKDLWQYIAKNKLHVNSFFCNIFIFSWFMNLLFAFFCTQCKLPYLLFVQKHLVRFSIELR